MLPAIFNPYANLHGWLAGNIISSPASVCFQLSLELLPVNATVLIFPALEESDLINILCSDGQAINQA